MDPQMRCKKYLKPRGEVMEYNVTLAVHRDDKMMVNQIRWNAFETDLLAAEIDVVSDPTVILTMDLLHDPLPSSMSIVWSGTTTGQVR